MPIANKLFSTFESLRKVMHNNMEQLHPSLTHVQFFALTLIKQNPSISASQMSNCFYISPSAMTQLINKMVDQGYLTRHSDPKDRRRTILHLTQKAENHYLQSREIISQAVADTFEVLDKTEVENLIQTLQKVINYNQQN